jgi:hypothetical protein
MKKSNPSSKTRSNVSRATAYSAVNDKQIGRVPTYRPFTGEQEFKVSDVTGTGQTIGSSGTVFLLNPIGQGTDTNQRIGNEYIMKELSIKYSFVTTGQTTAADETNVFRAILFYDKEPKGVLPGVSELLSLVRPDSTYQDSNKGRFIVIDDEYNYVGLNGPMAVTKSIIRRLNMWVGCNSTSSTISAIQTGAFCFLVISDSTIVPNPVLNFTSRIAYTDS